MENKPASLLVVSLGQDTERDAFAFMWQTGDLPALHRATIVKLLTQHVAKGDTWNGYPTMAVRLVGGGATSHS